MYTERRRLASRLSESVAAEGVLRAAEHKKESKTLALTVGEGLAPSGGTWPYCEKRSGEFAWSASFPILFLDPCFLLTGGASPSPTMLTGLCAYLQ